MVRSNFYLQMAQHPDVAIASIENIIAILFLSTFFK